MNSGEAASTLDAMFRRTAARRPSALALADPPNRADFTEGQPVALTYAEADRAISVAAGHLRSLGLQTGDLVAIQLGNTVESVIAFLAAIRAGLVAVPIPLLWRHGEAASALSRVGAKALISCGRIGACAQGEAAREIAAYVLSVGHVCGFGPGLPDGMVRLDAPTAADPAAFAADGDDAGTLAAVTFDLLGAGLIPVARGHGELVAGGLGVLLEGDVAETPVILTTLMGSSFAALATGVLAWLLSEGTLALHQPFDPDAFAHQRRELRPDVIVLPGAMIAQLASAGHLLATEGLKTVVAVWRAPERLPREELWENPAVAVVDVQVFGEAGFVIARRGEDGKPAAVPFGPVTTPRGAQAAIDIGEVMPTDIGTVALRGAIVPSRPFPPDADRDGRPRHKVLSGGYIDTGYTCRLDRETKSMVVTGPPRGVVSVGGYRFRAGDLEETIRTADARATLAALPDALAGRRLAGTAPEPEALQRVLTRRGVNPLVIAAFNGRRTAP